MNEGLEGGRTHPNDHAHEVWIWQQTRERPEEGRIQNDHGHNGWIWYRTRERMGKWHIQNTQMFKEMGPCASDLVVKD